MQSAPKKTAQTIIDSGNDYLGALKGNQSGLLKGVQANFKAQETITILRTELGGNEAVRAHSVVGGVGFNQSWVKRKL